MRFLYFLLDCLFPPRASELAVRHANEADLIALLSPFLISIEGTNAVDEGLTHASSKIIALLPYKNSLVQACILEAKFHDNKRAATLLGNVLREYLINNCVEDSTVLIPLPLSAERYKSRGYNQSERIVRAAADLKRNDLRANAPAFIISETLTRTRDTLPQTTLSGQLRRKNMNGAFRASQPPNKRHTYIVIDDVVTTGSTLSAAIQALKDSGAHHAAAIALAH